MSRSYTHAAVDTAEVQRVERDGAPKYSVSSVMGYLKGKSSLMIFDRFANLKYKYGNREFWCRGYYVDTVGRNKAAIEKYIRNQLIEDKNEEQLVMKELRTGNSYEGSGEQYKAPEGKIDRSCFSSSPGKSATGSLFQGAYQRLPVLCPYRAWSNHRLGRWS